MNHNIKKTLLSGKSGTAGNKERQEMLALFHQPEKEYEIKNELLKDLEGYPVTDESLPDMQHIFSGIWKTIEKKKQSHAKNMRYLSVVAKIAAVLVIGLFLGIFITSVLTDKDSAYHVVHSPLGSVSEWTLPDGTVIFLNSGSEIRYRVNANNASREVFLKGEAWFQVERDKKKQFVVHTPLYDVQVTGTRFNVKAYEEENRVTTTLEEGEIIIQSINSNFPDDGIILKPGQQLILSSKSEEPEIKYVNPNWFTAWKDNKLILINMPLKELLVLLERKYGVEFIIKDENVLNYHCDGTFQGETLMELMEILKRMIPINYTIVGQSIEITAQ